MPAKGKNIREGGGLKYEDFINPKKGTLVSSLNPYKMHTIDPIMD